MLEDQLHFSQRGNVYDDRARIEEMHVWGRQQYDDWERKTFDEQEDLYLAAHFLPHMELLKRGRKEMKVNNGEPRQN